MSLGQKDCPVRGPIPLGRAAPAPGRHASQAGAASPGQGGPDPSEHHSAHLFPMGTLSAVVSRKIQLQVSYDFLLEGIFHKGTNGLYFSKIICSVVISFKMSRGSEGRVTNLLKADLLSAASEALTSGPSTAMGSQLPAPHSGAQCHARRRPGPGTSYAPRGDPSA